MIPCTSCSRHLLDNAQTCPFCESPIVSVGKKLRLAIGAGTTTFVLAACYGQAGVWELPVDTGTDDRESFTLREAQTRSWTITALTTNPEAVGSLFVDLDTEELRGEPQLTGVLGWEELEADRQETTPDQDSVFTLLAEDIFRGCRESTDTGDPGSDPPAELGDDGCRTTLVVNFTLEGEGNLSGHWAPTLSAPFEDPGILSIESVTEN